MSITAEQWGQIEQQIGQGCIYGRAELLIDDVKIVLVKEFIGENKLAIVVYRDGFMSLKGCFPRDKEFSEKLVSVYKKHSKSVYNSKEKARLIKAFGIRKARKEFYIDKVQVSYRPWFMTFKPLKAQYKKLENIELVSLGYQEMSE